MSRASASRFELREIETVLGKPVATLIERISGRAQENDLAVYLAGGVARDLLLRRRTIDLDLVVEGDAIRFAKSLASEFGGAAKAHQPFGTAKWTLDERVGENLSLAVDALPASVDFVTVRGETYAQPAALPRVSPGSIACDLRRRDFSVNALAIQLSPADGRGALLDVCGGLDDLQRGLIRALHEQSFVDDPTRSLRALRYARRLGFQVERRTDQWMRAALPFLARVSGQRLRNEIDLILREAGGGQIMLALQELGALARIQPAFRVSQNLPALLSRCEDFKPPWQSAPIEAQSRRWHVLLAAVDEADIAGLCDRLALTKAQTRSIVASAKLHSRLDALSAPDLRPSQVARMLDGLPDLALQVGWLLAQEHSRAQERIAAYASDWRWRKPAISGADLVAMGLPPGPRYRQILERLRFARIDGEVHSREDEIARLHALLTNDW